jgi:hypothetical protein
MYVFDIYKCSAKTKYRKVKLYEQSCRTNFSTVKTTLSFKTVEKKTSAATAALEIPHKQVKQMLLPGAVA